jgi:hypothetical protein
MCEKHHRLIQMQKTAKADGKYMPSLWELESLAPQDMACPDCGVKMHWVDDEERSSGAILQHYRDGSLAIVCHSCNVKHGHMPGDMYRDVPCGHKLCVSCKSIKSLSEFGVRNDGKKPYPLSKCKACSREAYLKWKHQNPERYKALNKKHNDKRKANTNGSSI